MDIEEIYTPLNRTLLISLHPEYVSAIMNQTKIIEYRKRFSKTHSRHLSAQQAPTAASNFSLTVTPQLFQMLAI